MLGWKFLAYYIQGSSWNTIKLVNGSLTYITPTKTKDGRYEINVSFKRGTTCSFFYLYDVF